MKNYMFSIDEESNNIINKLATEKNISRSEALRLLIKGNRDKVQSVVAIEIDKLILLTEKLIELNENDSKMLLHINEYVEFAKTRLSNKQNGNEK